MLLTAGMLLGVASGASAIDFKAKGQWIFGFGFVDNGMTDDVTAGNRDLFNAQQRVRLQIDAVASEALSATVFFEIGDQKWGNQAAGAALGTDGIKVEVKRAYLDWYVPNTNLSFRMGLQDATLPNVAGGPAILSDDVAGVVANYKINDMASVTFAWFRPYNDNYTDATGNYDNFDNTHNRNNYLDNLDMFLLSVPIQGPNWSVNPWIALGFIGDNVAEGMYDRDSGYWAFQNAGSQDVLVTGTSPMFGGQYAAAHASTGGIANNPNNAYWNEDDDAYSTIWFAGLPMSFQHEAWNFELDLNYGYVQYSGSYFAENFAAGNNIGGTHNSNRFWDARVNNARQGWLIKGLVEYKMDWGTPGLFAWYGSGDDSDVKNGSEMMPYISPAANFTSFIGDGELGWQPGAAYDNQLHYSGTWGIGLQIKDLSFVEDLSHVIRIAYWGGTNSSAMRKYIETPYLSGGSNAGTGFYMVEGDYLVEVNFDTKYQIYENLSAHVQLGYIFNGINHDEYKYWDGTKRLGDARDGYKATLTFQYSF